MFQKCQIDKCTYERMQYFNEDEPFYQGMTYAQFIEWNNECFEQLSVDHRNTVVGLCRLITENTINLIDEESCVEWQAAWVFFNKKGKICVMHPR